MPGGRRKVHPETELRGLPRLSTQACHDAAYGVVNRQWVQQFATATAVRHVASFQRRLLGWRRSAQKNRSGDESDGQSVSSDSTFNGCGVELVRSKSGVLARQAQDDKSGRREQAIARGSRLLDQRMKHLGLRQVTMLDDGNCQFRALSHQLFGTQERHAAVRAAVVGHIKRHSEDYSVFFDGKKEFEAYLKAMTKLRTWGDEITIKAASEAFRVCVHVVTSTEAHCYVRYEPSCPREPEANAILAYISPVHYNSILHCDEPDVEHVAPPTPESVRQEKKPCCAIC